MHHLNVYQVDNIRNIHILSTLNLICYVSTDIRNDNLPDLISVALTLHHHHYGVET